MPRKKPYSNKQKKKQLQEKREKKRVKNLGKLTSKWLELTVSNMHKYRLLYNIFISFVFFNCRTVMN